MIKEERHKLIMELLTKENSVLVTTLSSRLAVSSVTIRKDLTELEKEKKLYRSHGSAILIDPYINTRPITEKEKLCADEKRMIGKIAASLITKDDSIIIASGSTVKAFSKIITPINKLTVITASLQIAEILAQNDGIDVIQLGGMLRHSSISVVGQYAEKMLANFSCSKLYLGVDGIDLDFGITTTNIMEATLNRQMISCSQKTIVLADSSKFGRRGFGKIAEMEDVDIIITDSKISPATAKRIEEKGIELIITTSSSI